MTETLELPLFEARHADPLVQRMVNVCRVHEGWLQARQIVLMLGMEDSETNRRHVRAWAEAAAGDLISGQKGYRHVHHATAEEINHFCHWMTSQAKKMAERAQIIRRRAHQLIG